MSKLKPEDRKEQILSAALKLASQPGGWSRLTRDGVAIEAGCAIGLPNRYFGTMITFKRAIMRAAIQRKILSIVAQGIATGDKCAIKAPQELKTAALQTLG